VNYNDYERYLSKPRLDEYRYACGGEEQKTLELYLLNIEVSKAFYGVLGLFEVALRNAINDHYKSYFSDENWIFNQVDNDFFTVTRKEAVHKEKDNLLKTKSYSSDRIVAVLNFGLWTDMFSSHCFNKGGQTLLKIFPNKQKGVNQKLIYKELKEIRFFRKHIAHYEAVCFDKQGEISAGYAENIWKLISKYTEFLGLPDAFLQNVESPVSNIRKLDEFAIWRHRHALRLRTML